MSRKGVCPIHNEGLPNRTWATQGQAALGTAREGPRRRRGRTEQTAWRTVGTKIYSKNALALCQAVWHGRCVSPLIMGTIAAPAPRFPFDFSQVLVE